ncbi:hypothetical protein LBYZC6_37450 [Lacrimispora brassicae]
MPMGRTVFTIGTDNPVRELKFAIKKSAYLKYPSIPKEKTREATSHALPHGEPEYRWINKPRT